MAVGVHVYFVSVLHNGNRLEISQIETGKTNRDVGFAARDAPVSVGVIVDQRTGGDHCQILRVSEGQVVLGKLRAHAGIPGATGGNEINSVAGILDDVSFVVDFDFMRPGGIEGGIRDQHDEVVIVTRYEVGADRFALKHLNRAAVDAGGSGLHAARYIERDGETEGALRGEGEARDRFEHEVVIDGAFDAEIVECVFRTLDDGATTSRARREAGPGIEVGSIIVVG